MNKQQLAAKIWESANRMRGKVDASEYKDFILGFIFYKYLSEKEEQFFLGEGMTASDMEQLVEEDEETVGYAQNHLGYFISYQNLFSTWIQAGSDFAVSQVYEALSAFSRLVSPLYKNVFDGIFITLQTGLSKLGDNTGSQTKAVRDLVHLIQTIPMSTHQDYDVLGYIYGAYHAFLFLEYQYGFQVVLARRMEYFHERLLHTVIFCSAFHMAAYFPFSASSSSWVPDSLIVPSATTRI